MQVWTTSGDDGGGDATSRAAQVIRDGGVVAIPTETFIGLAADLRRPAALDRVHAIKGRAAEKPLLLLVEGVAAARALAPRSPALLEDLARCFWPGPLTLVLPAHDGLPSCVVSGSGGVAVRQPGHEVALELVRRVGAPVTGTSANLAGSPAVRRAADLHLPGIDGILDAGETPGGSPSTLLDLCGDVPRILRAGAITTPRLREIVGDRLL